MTKANTKPSAAVVYDAQTADHAAQSVNQDALLFADAQRLGGMDAKEFRAGFYVGTIAEMLAIKLGRERRMEDGVAIMAKKQPLARNKKDTDTDWKNRLAARRAEIKAGTVTERTKDETSLYQRAVKRYQRFTDAHNIEKAQTRKDKGETKPAKDEPKDNTPKAINAKQVDSYLRMQAAVMLAYLEKNGAMAESRDAWHSALQELKESVAAIPVVLSDRELAETK